MLKDFYIENKISKKEIIVKDSIMGDQHGGHPNVENIEQYKIILNNRR